MHKNFITRHFTALYILLLVTVIAIALAYEKFRCQYYDHKIQTNFESHKKTLLELESFVKKKHSIMFQFDHYPKINLVTWLPSKDGDIYVKLWETTMEDPKFLNVLQKIGWTMEEVYQLHQMLQTADCFSIDSYGPDIPLGVNNADRGIEVGYRRNFLLGYWAYFVFPRELSKSQMEIEPSGYQELKYLNGNIGWAKMR